MWNARGQSTVEYAVIFAVVIAALLTMNVYVKRGAMGKLKESADQLGEQFNPYVTTSSFDNSYKSARQEVTNADGSSSSTITADGGEVQKRENGTVTVDSLDKE